MDKTLNEIKLSELVWTPEKGGTPILDGISATLEEGEFYGILGPNGAGKTSVARQLIKLKNPTSGSVMLDEENIESISRERIANKLSFLPQNIKSDVDFTVLDVVAMGREPHRRSFSPLNEEDLKKIDEAMDFTNCGKLKNKRISLLSGGERQRVMIARTIAQDTPWIILDEPVSNLDVKHQRELMLVLEKLRFEKGKTIVAILHDINLAMRFCSKAILMKDGDIFKMGNTKDVITSDNLEKVYEMKFEFIKSSLEQEYVMPIWQK